MPAALRLLMPEQRNRRSDAEKNEGTMYTPRFLNAARKERSVSIWSKRLKATVYNTCATARQASDRKSLTNN